MLPFLLRKQVEGEGFCKLQSLLARFSPIEGEKAHRET